MQQFHFDEIDSTNNWIKRNLNLIPCNEILWVTADSQTMGRGQHGKSWVSPKGKGLWTSFAFWKTDATTHTPISIEVAAVLKSFLIERYGLNVTVKPPNDLLVNGKKLCGILCETAWYDEKEAIIIGIGLNVNDSPKQVSQPTTSLLEEGVITEIPQLLKELQNCRWR